MTTISGAGGKDGGGASEQADSLRSTQSADVLDLLSEGECEGLTNGLKSIYLDGVPLQNADGNFNFTGAQVALVYGTQGQGSIAGADGVQNEIAVAVTVLAATAIVRTITSPAIDRVRVTIAVPQLSEQDTGSGSLKGAKFTWAVDLQSNGGGYVQVFTDTVDGKTMSRYTRAKVFKLTGAAPWDIRVRRVTADASSAAVVNAFQWASYTEIQSLQLRYPNSAMARVRVDAQQFARIPVRGYDFMGVRVQVPVNYDPISRVYTGVWNGTFKVAWTDNPAWMFHDMVRHNRYGLGRYVPTTEAFKWEMYSIGQYSDVMVDDGRGGLEPRFRCGVVLSTREQAYKVLTDLAAVFRGMCYWANTDVAVTQDAPSDPVAIFSPANVVDQGGGKYFTYSGASNGKRHSSVVVWFNNLAEQGKLVPEVVVDRVLEARFGVRPLELSPLGVWSRGQAQRIGKWVLYSEQFENQTVSFRVGLDGTLVPPGRTFQAADPNEAGERLGGRVRSATTTAVTLDAEVTLAAGESYLLTAMVKDPADPARLRPEQRAVTTAAGVRGVLTVAAPFSSAPAPANMWVLQSDGVALTNWRCLSVAEVKGSNDFEMVGLAHEPAKYALIEQGIAFEARPVSRITAVPTAPTLLLFTETAYLFGPLYRSRVTVSWREPARGLQYTVSWRMNGSFWNDVPRTSGNSLDLEMLQRGLLEVAVRSVNALGKRSLELAGSTQVLGNLVATGALSLTGDAATATPAGGRFYSKAGFSGGAYVSFTVQPPTSRDGATQNAVIGLTVNDPVMFPSFPDFTHGIHPSANTSLYAYESGVAVGLGTGWAYGDRLAVSYDRVAVRYFKNGELLRTAALSSTAPVFVSGWLFAAPATQTVVDDIGFGPLADLSGATAAANAAAAAAAAAQSSANAALTQLTEIASDNILSPIEKPRLIQDYGVVGTEQAGIDAQATNYAVTTEKAAYDAAISALATYLATLTSPVAWNDLSGTTSIVGTTFRLKWSAVYTTRQAVLDQISANAKARLGALATLNTVDTAQIAANAATDVYQNNFDFAGAAFSTSTPQSFTVTPAVASTVEFTAKLAADYIVPDSGNTMSWYVTPAGGTATRIGGAQATTTAKQEIVGATAFAAAAGVTLTFELRLVRASGNPAIHLFDSFMRVTVVKR